MNKLVIFDLDGTLLDTLEDIGISVNFVLKELGYNQIALENFRYLVGEGTKVLMQKAMPDADEEKIQKALSLFEEHYNKQYSQNTKMYPDINKVLTFLARREFHMAVLSNKPHKFVKKCVLKYLDAWKFDAVYGVRENIPRKPDPAGAIEILKELDIKPQECLYVGDTSTDMITANKAGVTPIGVLWGFRDKEELLESGAKYIVKTPAELLTLIATIESIN